MSRPGFLDHDAVLDRYAAGMRPAEIVAALGGDYTAARVRNILADARRHHNDPRARRRFGVDAKPLRIWSRKRGAKAPWLIAKRPDSITLPTTQIGTHSGACRIVQVSLPRVAVMEQA